MLVPLISPFRDDRETARRASSAPSAFVEVYVDTPLAVCESRDVKGLYRKARAGEIPGFTGVSSPYEPPETPFLRLDTTHRTVDECAEELLARVRPLLAP